MSRGKRGGRAAEMYAQRQAETVIDDAEEEEEVTPVEEPEEEEEPIAVVPADEEEADDDEEEADDADPEAALSVLQRQLATVQAERDQLAQRAQVAEVDTAVSQHAVLQQALGAAKAGVREAEAAIEAASKAGDHKAVAAATVRLNKALIDVDKFEIAADDLKNEIQTRRTAKPTAHQQGADPYLEGIKEFSEPSKQWLIKHRAKIEGNPKAGQKALALAQLAMADGVEVDSPEFFKRLNEGMGFADVTTPPKKNPKPAPARKQVGAPTGARSGGTARQEVVLTRAEREAAQAMGMTTAKYAKYKLELQKNAQDPNRTGPRLSAHAAHIQRGR